MNKIIFLARLPAVIKTIGVLALVSLSTPVLADGHGNHEGTLTPHEYAIPSNKASEALLLDVAVAGSRMVAVGEFGHILLSEDGGENWTQAASVPTRNTLVGVTFIDNQTGFAVGHAATILKTIDGGRNWTLQNNERNGETPLFAVYFADAQNGIAVGGFSYTFETSNGGQTWSQRTLVEDSYDDFHLNDLFADNKGNVYIPAEFGTVYKSVDRGRNWKAIETGYDGSFWGGLGLENGDVLVFGMRGNVWRSSDNGQSWKKVETGTDQSVSGGTQLEDGRIVLAGLSGTVLLSNNGGQSFDNQPRPDRLSFATAIGKSGDDIILLGAPGIKKHNLSE
ncbi:YCF48-related protein [Alphaproteobacteria bacterium]|nr:YCF48-related protein [Alphaproteobacteria bacterium]MDA8625386.1 YCF48-related protein [Alphaproteobacteria bacterium]MDA8642887.1 YCF48-related protein [Alphaproteobacteria bacterium]MDA8667163.1 YCF48-related protein [Alphaproteobacteria bacterium]MDA8780215.1 YCF48-related protein [Alphaproteobacteria bacterium]